MDSPNGYASGYEAGGSFGFHFASAGVLLAIMLIALLAMDVITWQDIAYFICGECAL